MRQYVRIIFLAILIAVSMIPLSVSAQDERGYLVLKPGLYSPYDGGNISSSTGFAGEVGLGYNVTPFIILELAGGYYKTTLSGSALHQEYDLGVAPLLVTALAMHRFENGHTAAGLGSGMYTATLQNRNGSFAMNDKDTVFGFHLVFGSAIDITKKMFIGFELKYLFTGTAHFVGPTSYVSYPLDGATFFATIGTRF